MTLDDAMNIYTTDFFAFCPVNGVRVKYDLRIETIDVVEVERIIDEVTLHSKGFHEEIADALSKSLGGRQYLIAHHHGVQIETHRPLGEF